MSKRQARTVIKTLRAMWPRSIPAADYDFLLQLVDKLREPAEPARVPFRGTPIAPAPEQEKRKRKQGRPTRNVDDETAQMVLLAVEDEAGDASIKHIMKKTGFGYSAVLRSLHALVKANKLSRRRMPKSRSPNPPFGYTRVKPE